MMVKKNSKEWNIDTSRGKIAMVSWGSSSMPPVLMVHGYVDTAATFILLAEHLSETYYYVAFDMPGHGKSDPLPPGPLVGLVYMVEVIRSIVEHMGWSNFVYLGHSMAIAIGWIYNAVYPGCISRMISLDPGPPLTPYYEVNYEPHAWYNKRYNFYYENYGKSSSNPKLYKYKNIVEMLAKNRQLTYEQAEVVLSRSIVEGRDGLYILTWEPRTKSITTLSLSEDILKHILFKNTPPTLIIISSINDSSSEKGKIFASRIMEGYHRLENCSIVTIEGHHDVHITRPEKMAGIINEFLTIASCKSKL